MATIAELLGASSGEPSIRREHDIGLPTIATLGLGALALAAARRPGARQMLERLWQRKLSLPSDLPIATNLGGSPLISEHERVGSNVAKQLYELLEQPWVKEFRGARATAPGVESGAVSHYLAERAAGTPYPQAKSMAVSQTPDWFQRMQTHRDTMLPQAQAARRYMGMTRIPEQLGPYMHREAIREDIANLRGTGGLFGELRTGAGGAMRERTYPTYRAGQAAGITYEDPYVAWLSREVADLRIIETAKYLQQLENRVIFRDRGAAQAIAGPGKQVYTLEGLPGETRWYVPHYEEWKFLKDNLADPDYGRLGFLRNWGNALMRNPNLVNPTPHILKNMLYKYGLSGGNPGRLMADAQEFQRGRSPMVTLFKQHMPFDETGATGSELYRRAVQGIRREQYPGIVRVADLALDKTVGAAQRFSTRTIFAKADPIMRFSRFKQYIERGMSAAEAANHVHLDLIRYGTRSGLVDFWKSVPGNFFVPWRLGTVTSVWKQLQSHPIRAALLIGGIDLLREIRYRQTGRWTHLPIDYIEQPIAQILQGKDREDSAKSLIAATLATIAFGPGGGMAASTLIDLLKDIKGQGELGRAVNMFWGISQLVDGGKSGAEIASALKRGDGQAAARAASNLLTSFAIAEHSALNYRPRRLFAALPEVGPWLEKSAMVKQAEAMQEGKERRGERGQQRQERRKEPMLPEWVPGHEYGPRRGRTIEDLLKAGQEAR